MGNEEMEETELIEWLRRKAPLEQLCEVGGWPDDSQLHIDICSQSENKWLIRISFNEHIQEISECEPSVYERCGKFAVHFDATGQPADIRLILRM